MRIGVRNSLLSCGRFVLPYPIVLHAAFEERPVVEAAAGFNHRITVRRSGGKMAPWMK